MAHWNRSRALMQRGRFTPLQCELIATAASIGNACTYCIDSHVATMMRLGVDEVGVAGGSAPQDGHCAKAGADAVK
jgi:AhpD family alkylhydroperoxidase